MMDWEARFRAQHYRIQPASHNHRRALIRSTSGDSIQLFAWEVGGELVQISDDPHGKGWGSISADGTAVYYLWDEAGDELGHFVRVPASGGVAQDISPDSPPYGSWSVAESTDESENGSQIAYVIAGEGGYALQVHRRGSDGIGPPRQVWHSSAFTAGPVLSADGALAVVETTEKTQRTEMSLVAIDLETATVVAELEDANAGVDAFMFRPAVGDAWLAATTTTSGFARPVLWNVRTRERRELQVGDLPGDWTIWDWSADTDELLLKVVVRALTQVYVYNLAENENRRLTALPNGSFGGGGFLSIDEIVAWHETATDPARVVALQRADGSLASTLLSDVEYPGRPWRSVTFASAGAQVQAWLAEPDAPGPHPMILHTHGGPTGVLTEGFSAEAQAWLDHGFAFMSVNYHGSTTFGRDFQQSIQGALGTVEVDDMAAARAWAVGEGVARPDQVLVSGLSYGGYLTLQAMGRRPELWAGGIATVAIADWALMYEDQAPTLRGSQVAFFGGTPDETAYATRVASPITYADDFAAPILVIQGRNDTRCPARQMEAFVAKLTARGKDISVHWFDAGHGSLRVSEQIEHMALSLAFARRVIDERP